MTTRLRWEKDYRRLFTKFLSTHAVFDGSEVSAWMRKHGLRDPEHHNFWGAQIAYYAGQGLIKKLGHVAPMNKHSHIRTVQLWRRV